MEQSQQIDKVVRLIEYLIRLADVHRRYVKDIANYNQVLWLHDIPKHKGCFTPAWGSSEEYDESVWLEIQCRHEPPLPKIPNVCRDWVNTEALYIKTDVPLLNETFNQQIENPNWSEGSDQAQFLLQTEKLGDYPDVMKKWEQYIKQKWKPWREDHNQWEAIQKVYSQLFTIHQEQLKLGEQYELVIGLGLLTWQTPQNQQIQRHLFVATASLEFDSRLGKFTVRPNADGASLRPELDMLESYQPTGAEEFAKEGLQSANDNPWDRNVTTGVLKGLVHSIDSKGEYHDRLRAESPRTIAKPLVEYAPALILRKRSVRGLTEILRKIKDQIEEGLEIPPEFQDLAEIPQDQEYDNEPGDGEHQSPSKFDGEIYFPKPFNKEQRQILEKLRQSNGVLVQGPPGTGKSHTIANLICHLLATGNRILVTAKTPRALLVIERQLPEQVRPLCVNLLGSGTDERRALENSMGAVLQKTQAWNLNTEATTREKLEKVLKSLRAERAEIEVRLRSIRESETHPQIAADGAYRGTAAQIARAVKTDSSEYDWFADEVSFDAICPFNSQDLLSLLEGLRFLTEEKKAELQMLWPTAGLPSEEELLQLFENERMAQEQEEEALAALEGHTEFLEQLQSLDRQSVGLILQALSCLREQLQELRALPYDWVSAALLDVSTGHDSALRELHFVTEAGIAEISDLVRNADSTELVIPEGVDPKVIRKDAESLRDILAAGGKIGWWPFRSKAVRPLIYLTNTMVDGQKCKNLEHVTSLVNALHVQLQLKHLWNFWKGRAETCEGPYSLQFRELEAHCNALAKTLSVSESIQQCRKVIPGHGNNPAITWHEQDSIISFIHACKYALAQLNKDEAKNKILTIIQPIKNLSNQDNAHPIVAKLLDSVENRSIDDFIKVKHCLLELENELLLFKKTEDLHKKVAQHAPILANNLATSHGEKYWIARLQSIKKAWDWARAQSWLNNYINKEDAISLAQRVTQIDHDLEAAMAKLASNKAWSFCFSRMSEPHRRHMEAWQQAMKRLGKGTGKYAPKHRRDARQNLNECRDAVPAWVMPLHRIWDTVEPSAGMFDVVIVDEASQCGMEALPLLYLGKKVLIVGDDKQIAPEAVGVPQNIVHRLAEELLYDFEFKESFGVTSSLFGQGKLRYSTRRISLREHFRCMPEIIQFSNDLCYSGEPLIPLRQYGADRLKPLQRVHVQNGYREGDSNRVINGPEADAIVSKIVELCGNKQLAEKTMGVVILQGAAQANLIENLLLQALGAEEMERRRLICGNPYSFQGDERDIIFLSMVAAPNKRIGPFTRSDDERRFNVAASRAKDQMWLFHSVTRNDLSNSCYRSKLLAFFEETPIKPIVGVDYAELEKKVSDTNRSVVNAPDPFDSWFEVDVALELAREKYRIIPQFEVAGKYIDLVIDGGGPRLAVECDGDAFHGTDHFEQDMARQRILERCHWAFFRIRESEFYANKDAVLSKLRTVLENRGIFPIGMYPSLEEPESAPDMSQNESSQSDDEEEEFGVEASQQDLASTGERSDYPSDIHEALKMRYPYLRDAIISMLKTRPNQACVRRSVVKFLLQYFEIISRGRPREAFAYKVDQIVAKMGEVGILKIYIATNERVKLEPEPYLSIALSKDMNL